MSSSCIFAQTRSVPEFEGFKFPQENGDWPSPAQNTIPSAQADEKQECPEIPETERLSQAERMELQLALDEAIAQILKLTVDYGALLQRVKNAEVSEEDSDDESWFSFGKSEESEERMEEILELNAQQLAERDHFIEKLKAKLAIEQTRYLEELAARQQLEQSIATLQDNTDRAYSRVKDLTEQLTARQENCQTPDMNELAMQPTPSEHQASTSVEIAQSEMGDQNALQAQALPERSAETEQQVPLTDSSSQGAGVQEQVSDASLNQAERQQSLEQMASIQLDTDEGPATEQAEATSTELETISSGVTMPPSSAPPVSTQPFGVSQEWILEGLAFRKNSTKIDSESVESLQNLLKHLKENSGLSVQINGYTDSRGSTGLNQRLSKERADAVTDYLVNQGIEPFRVRALGYGELRPIADNETEEGRVMNRRIGIILLP